MIDLELAAIPNQSISMRLDGRLYTLTVKETRGVMSVDVTRDNVVLLSGQRIVAGTPLIPYQYLESGNFVLVTEKEEYPEYAQFGITQSLVYVSDEEIAALRA